MTWLTKLYNSIKNWKAPEWLKILIQQLNDLMIAILKKAGQAYIDHVKALVLEAASHQDWSSEQKYQYVFDQAKKGFIEFSISIKDSELNAIIEFLVNQFKKQGAIK